MHFQICEVGFVDKADKMQGEDALKTVECLRGRLLAERAASRAANESAENMNNKLKELEEQLKIETKCRRKAEKKLSILKKKLESLNITFSISEESDQSSSSWDHSETSCISSAASITDNAEQIEKTKPEINMEHNVQDNAEQTEKTNPEINTEQNVQDVESDNGFKSSAMEEKTTEGENEADGSVDNSLALVPVNLPIESNSSSNEEMKVNSESVRDVLHSLKQIRENIQGAMERRRSIKVG